ncbi:hypothetical protein F4808DRAFT_458494 [Astrocystis sublimbata]|nr:hypothetical protein F4808DRAFT_458494 [Astrocystis sublimbata]
MPRRFDRTRKVLEYLGFIRKHPLSDIPLRKGGFLTERKVVKWFAVFQCAMVLAMIKHDLDQKKKLKVAREMEELETRRVGMEDGAREWHESDWNGTENGKLDEGSARKA